MTATRRRADDTAQEIARALDQLMRLHVNSGYKDALKPAQWHALRYFAQAAPAQRTVTAFARHRTTSAGTASTTVSGLVARGLLLRDYGNGMPRNRGLHISPAGMALLDSDPIWTLAGCIAALDPASRQTLSAALPKLVAGMTPPGDAETAA